MNTINENLPENIQLSSVEKYVLAKLVASETPTTAYGEITKGANMVAAMDKLTKIQYMEAQKGTASITEQGMEALRKEALLDEMGELTEEGQIYGFASSPEEAAQAEHAQTGKPEAPITPSQQQNPMGGNMPTDATSVATQGSGEADAFALESLKLIQGIRGQLKEAAFLKKSKL